MARKSDRQIIEELLEQFEPEIRAAFLAAIEDIVDNIDLSALIAALRKSDINAALRALHIEPAAFRQLERVITAAFEAGGSSMRLTMPVIRDTSGIRIGVRFDPGDPAAADRIRRHGANLVTRIVEDQRTSLRKAISEGMARGTNPRTVGIEIAGRYDPRLGRRTGGIIGLTDGQREIADRAYRMLLHPKEIRGYFIVDEKTGVWKPRYAASDRTFHPAIRKAINEGKALDAQTAARAAERHRDGLLKMRADTIARNETGEAVGAGQAQSIEQTLREAGISEDMVEKTWRATKDKRTRDSHRSLDGKKVRGLNTHFISGAGNYLRWPHDPEAPLEDRIQCRCVVTYRIMRAEEVS